MGLPLPAFSSAGLLLLGASLSPHPYSSSLAEVSDLLAFKGDGDGLGLELLEIDICTSCWLLSVYPAMENSFEALEFDLEALEPDL